MAGRPTGPIEHSMEILEAGLAGQPQGAERGGDGVVGRSQQRAAQ